MTSPRTLAAALVALTLAVAACDAGDPTVRLLAYDPAEDRYTLQDRTLTTLDDVPTLSGEATRLIGGAAMILDYRRNELRWDDPGNEVAFLAHDVGGVLQPEDYDSLAMATIYFNVESTVLLLERLGLPGELVPPSATYYEPRFETIDPDGTERTLRDNAFYLYLSGGQRAFVILPFEQFEWVPMALNQGIAAHEYTHAVFDGLVLLPVSRRGVDLDNASVNQLAGLAEGISDFIAVTLTGDPDFIAPSIPPGVFVIQCNQTAYTELVRDASRFMAWDGRWDAAARSVAPLTFCPYQMGEFYTAALYETARRLDDDGDAGRVSATALEGMARRVLGFLATLGAEGTAPFGPATILETLAAGFAAGADRETLCAVLAERAADVEVPSCAP